MENVDFNGDFDFKRKVPTGIRPTPGHVPSTVFNSTKDKDKHKITTYLQEQRTRERVERSEEKKKDMEMLNNYNPWGKPGGGAPRQSGPQMMKLNAALNSSQTAAGSLVEHMENKPGGGAPYRTESGNPTGVVTVHPDIRNNLDMMNEETKKKSLTSGLNKPKPGLAPNGEERFHKSQSLSVRQKTNDDVRNNLKERLERQIDEKRLSVQSNKSVSLPDQSSDWITGKVGYVQRDGSGKILRSEKLTNRGANHLREFYDQNGDKGIVEQFGRPGPGVALRTESGKTHAQPRGMATNCDDPFRPNRNNSNSPVRQQVFPVNIEDEAKERAWKRKPDMSPPVNKHTVQNGYYAQENAGQTFGSRVEPHKPIGTVYSAITRTKESYLQELQSQIHEREELKTKERQISLDQDFQHIRNSDIFGRPGNGAPRLYGGSLQTSINKLQELATQCEGVQHPGTFRGLH